MDFTSYYKDQVRQAVVDWMELNPDFLCGLRYESIWPDDQMNVILVGDIQFAPSSPFIRDSNVWGYTGEFIIHSGKENSREDSYHGMLSCLNELFAIPRPILCV